MEKRLKLRQAEYTEQGRVGIYTLDWFQPGSTTRCTEKRSMQSLGRLLLPPLLQLPDNLAAPHLAEPQLAVLSPVCHQGNHRRLQASGRKHRISVGRRSDTVDQRSQIKWRQAACGPRQPGASGRAAPMKPMSMHPCSHLVAAVG